MRVQRRDGTRERKILTAMIVDRTVLARLAAKWDRELFSSDWSNIIGGWCVDFFRKYGTAPGKDVTGLYEKWAEISHDKETTTLIESYLGALSGEYAREKKEVNPQLILDYADELFNKVRAKRLSEKVQENIEDGDVEKALALIQGFSKVELSAKSGIDFFQDMEAFRSAFEDAAEILVQYHGALGEFFDDAFERDGFVAFQAPEKRGKTWWLLDVACRAVMQRRRTAFFEVGDMSEKQLIRRLASRFAKRPLRAKAYKYPRSIKVEDGKADVDLDDRQCPDPLDWRESWRCVGKFLKTSVKSKESYFKISVHPNNAISAVGVKSILSEWSQQGWDADVVIIDYADLLAPINGTADTRDQINATWKELRAISQIYHNLVITATQADAASYTADTMSKSNFSEDKRKLAHVTGMVGINQTEVEKLLGVQRLNWIVRREAESHEKKCVHVAGCLAIGNPALRSSF